MAYIIGISIKVSDLHQVIDHRIVREKRFNQELQDAIKQVYPKDEPIHQKLREMLTHSAEHGLNTYRSVHIAGKYFFKSASQDKKSTSIHTKFKNTKS